MSGFIVFNARLGRFLLTLPRKENYISHEVKNRKGYFKDKNIARTETVSYLIILQ